MFLFFSFFLLAVQNERQPRNTATIKPESLREMDQSKILREHSSLVGIFGYLALAFLNCYNFFLNRIDENSLLRWFLIFYRNKNSQNFSYFRPQFTSSMSLSMLSPPRYGHADLLSPPGN